MAFVTLGGSGKAGVSHAAADRAARVGACLERARNGETAALNDVVHELNPLLWRGARGRRPPAAEATGGFATPMPWPPRPGRARSPVDR